MHARSIPLLIALLSLPAGAGAQASDLSFLDVPERPHDAATRPDADAARGLAELEGELGRFGGRLRGYRSAIDQLATQRARRARRDVALRYSAEIRTATTLEANARDTAIRRLIAFVRAHPNAPPYTPDALLRLADLQLQVALESEPSDFTRTIALTRRIVEAFADYRHRNRAAYLLGWALQRDPASPANAASDVWLSVVCANQHSYPPVAQVESVGRYPASEDDPERPGAAAGARYADCHAAAETPHESEIWLRLGEAHFDANQLSDAISAYRRVGTGPLYSFGLYKLAWSHYRSGHYALAIERFSQLVQHSDEELRRTGRAGSDLRTEAIRYIALTIAYDDWNEDGTPDHAAGGAHPLERLEDTELWRQDRAWAPEIYRAVGDVLFEEGHADEAILAWQLRLARYPANCDAPEVQLAIVNAQRQLGRDEAALRALRQMAAITGTDDCPRLAARQARVAWRALRDAGRIHHRRAQRLRERAELDNDDALRQRARTEYGYAVRAYTDVLTRFPNDSESYELGYDRAEALFWSERFEAAARAYAEVRDSSFDDRFFARAARRVVESYTRAAPDEPGAASARRISREQQRIARAREIYIRWVRHDEDTERVLDAYAYNNAALLQRHGYLAEAWTRFDEVFRDGCRGSNANGVARDAWMAMRDMAAAREDLDALDNLTRQIRERACTFSSDGPVVTAGACTRDANHVVCEEVGDLELRVTFARLSQAAEALAASATPIGEPSAARARTQTEERAVAIARNLVRAASHHPEHELAPDTLRRAALLLENPGRRSHAAAVIYRRIVDDYGGRTSDDPESSAHLDQVLFHAHFRLATLARRAFDHERAAELYTTLTTSRRFSRSNDPIIRQGLSDAHLNRSFLLSQLGRHIDAAAAWRDTAERLDEPNEARQARLRQARALLDSGDARAAARRLDTWLPRVDEPRFAIGAWSLRARAALEMSDPRARRHALEEAVRFHGVDALPVLAHERTLAAAAALALADIDAAHFVQRPIAPGAQPTMRDFVRVFGERVIAETERNAEIQAVYQRVVTIGRARESVAALRRRGALYESLVRNVLATRYTTPNDVRRQTRRASSAVRAEVRQQIEDAFRSALDDRLRPIECRAVEQYALSARLARRGSLATPDARRAYDRLGAYGNERVRECLDAAHARDATFRRYETGEFDRARDGLMSAPAAGAAPLAD